MNEAELSLIPLEARPYQGTAAGVVSRVAANAIDVLLVATTLVGGYVGFVAFRFVVAPRNFRVPAPTVQWAIVGFFTGLVLYLTAAWWISGRTPGDHVMGIRVVTGQRRRLRFARALARAILYAAFPVGLLWCAFDPKRRSLQDLVLRTSVIHDWLPRPTAVQDPESPA